MRLRQLPMLYLRGSLANETMRNLTEPEKSRLNALFAKTLELPELQNDRHEFINKLGRTIGGEYKDIRRAAEIEFEIAVWRGLVYLLYHCDYTFNCKACKSSQYTTQAGYKKNIDRRHNICPSCNAVQILGNSERYSDGDLVNFDFIQTHLRNGGDAVKHTSPIIAIPGEQKVTNPEEIINDKTQLVRFITRFVWNYMHQTLNENEIKFHETKPKLFVGAADEVAVREILSVLSRHKVVTRYYAPANPHNGAFRITASIGTYNTQVSRDIGSIVAKYRDDFGVQIEVHANEVVVKELTTDIKITQAMVLMSREVWVDTVPAGDSDTTNKIESLTYKFEGGGKMADSGMAAIESEGLLKLIRESLPDGAQQIFDIYTGKDEEFQRFSLKNFGPHAATRPRNAHIAKYLKKSNKQVNAWLNDIRMQCLAHDLVTVD